MIRRSSLTEDYLWRQFSHASDGRSSVALKSSLISIPEGAEKYNYGSIEDGDGNDGICHIPEDMLLSGRRRQHKRLSSLAQEGALVKDELLAMVSLAVPVIATYLLEMIPGIITIVLVGQMDNGEDTKLYVDAAALAVMYFNIIGMSTGLGLLTALDTLYASAHGANQPKKMGRYLLTGIVVMSIAFCIVCVAIYNTTSSLLFFNQPPALSHHAGVFAMWMLPGLPFLYAYELLRKLSQARNETLPMIVSAVVSVLTNVGVGYYMVNYTRLGWLGAALARTMGYMVLLPTLFIGIYHSEKEFLLQLWFEWAPFEVIALICGMFPDEEEAMIAIGANAIVLQISTVIYMLYVGTSMAGNVRIGNALGGGDVHRAKIASYLTLALGMMLSLLNILFIFAFREKLPYFFTSDGDLISKTKDLLVVVAFYQFPDAINGVSQGIFRGIGKQALSAQLNFVAYCVIGLPLGYVLALPLDLGVEGLWLGMTAGLLFVSTINTIILFRCDWQQLSLETMKRLSIAIPTENGNNMLL